MLDSISKELIEKDVREISRAYSQSRVVKLGNGSLGDPTVMFIQEQGYSGQFDKAKFYALMMPACFVQADIYQGNDYQYSIGTASGLWQERLDELKEAVGRVAKKGLDEIADKIEAEDLAQLDRPIE